MGQNEVKLIITTDASGAVTGIKGLEKEFTSGNQKMETSTASFASKVKAHWAGFTVAIAAASAAAYKGWDMMGEGAKASQAEESFKRVAASYQEDSQKILRSMEEAAAGTVDASDIMQKAVKGMLQGLGGNELANIMEAARVGARIAGNDVKDAYEEITDAIGNDMPRALKKYGLITKEQFAVVNEAINLGIKDINLYEIAMANATVQQAAFGELSVNAAEKMQHVKASIHDVTEELGKWLITGVGSFAAGWEIIGATVAKSVAGMQATVGSWFKSDKTQMKAELAVITADYEAQVKAIQQKWGLDAGAAPSPVGDATKAKNDLDDMLAKYKTMIAAAKEGGKAAEAAEKERLELFHERYRAYQQMLDEQLAAEKTLSDNIRQLTLDEFDYKREKKWEEYAGLAKHIGLTEELWNAYLLEVKKIADEEEAVNRAKFDAITEAEKSAHEMMFEVTATDLEKRLTAWDKWYDDYTGQLDQMELSDEEYNEKSIEAWIVAEKKKAEILAETQKTFSNGFAKGAEEYIKAIENQFARGEALAKDFAREGERALIDIWDDPTGAAQGFFDFLLFELKRTIAQFVMNPIMVQLQSVFSGSGSMAGLGQVAGYGMMGAAGYGIGSVVGGSSGGMYGTMGGLAGGMFAGTSAGISLIGRGLAPMLGTGSTILGMEIGSVIPVIGTIVGAILGSLLGGLFGDDEPPKTALRYSPGGVAYDEDYKAVHGDTEWGVRHWDILGEEATGSVIATMEGVQDLMEIFFEGIGKTPEEIAEIFAQEWVGDKVKMDDDFSLEAQVNAWIKDYVETISGVDFTQFQHSGEEFIATVGRITAAVTAISEFSDWDAAAAFDELDIHVNAMTKTIDDLVTTITDDVAKLNSGELDAMEWGDLLTTTADNLILLQQASLEYVAHIKALGETLHLTIEQQIQQYALDQMTLTERTVYWQEKVDKLSTDFETETDPDKIGEISLEMVGAIDQLYNALSESAAHIKAVAESLHQTIEQQIQQYAQGQMTTMEQIAYWQNEVDGLWTDFETETDPDKIGEISSELTNAIDQLYNSLVELQSAVESVGAAAEATYESMYMEMLPDDQARIDYVNQQVTEDWADYNRAKAAGDTEAMARIGQDIIDEINMGWGLEGVDKEQSWEQVGPMLQTIDEDMAAAGKDLDKQIADLTPLLQDLDVAISDKLTPAIEALEVQIAELTPLLQNLDTTINVKLTTAIDDLAAEINKLSIAVEGIDMAPLEPSTVTIITDEPVTAAENDSFLNIPNTVDYTPHAMGLDYVPYDGYKASLHLNEAVITSGANAVIPAIPGMLGAIMARIEGLEKAKPLVTVYVQDRAGVIDDIIIAATGGAVAQVRKMSSKGIR